MCVVLDAIFESLFIYALNRILFGSCVPINNKVNKLISVGDTEKYILPSYLRNSRKQ